MCSAAALYYSGDIMSIPVMASSSFIDLQFVNIFGNINSNGKFHGDCELYVWKCEKGNSRGLF
jgi:hypothetical protein